MSIVRYTAYNLAGSAIPVAVSLVTVPLYLAAIGLDRYGILAIYWLLAGYFNLFDFGLGRAIAQKIATLGRSPAEDRSRIFWEAAIVSCSLSCFAAAIFGILSPTAIEVLGIGKGTLVDEVNRSIPLLVGAVPLGIAQSLLVGSLEGRRAFFTVNTLLSCGTIATAALPLIVAKSISPTLPVLLCTVVATRFMVLAALCVACVRLIPIKRPRMLSKSETWDLVRFGGWVSISNVVGPVLVLADRFGVSAMLGAAAVALYVVPFNMVSQLTVPSAALASALSPRFATATEEDATLVSGDAIRALLIILTPLALCLVVVAAPFLKIWLGIHVGASVVSVTYALVLGLWANSLARVPAAKLVASGRPDILAKVHLIEIIPYLSLLYYLMKYYGLVGAAFAWSIRSFSDAFILYVLTTVNRRDSILLCQHFLIVAAGVSLSFLSFNSEWYLPSFILVLLVPTGVLIIRNAPIQLLQILRRIERSGQRRG